MDNDQLILQHLMKISEDIGSIKSDVSNLNENMTAHVKKDEQIQKEQEERLDKIEDQHKKVKWIAVGAGAVIGALFRVIEAMFGIGHGHQ